MNTLHTINEFAALFARATGRTESDVRDHIADMLWRCSVLRLDWLGLSGREVGAHTGNRRAFAEAVAQEMRWKLEYYRAAQQPQAGGA